VQCLPVSTLLKTFYAPPLMGCMMGMPAAGRWAGSLCSCYLVGIFFTKVGQNVLGIVFQSCSVISHIGPTICSGSLSPKLTGF